MARTKNSRNKNPTNPPQKSIAKARKEIKEPTEQQLKWKKLNNYVNPLYGNKCKRNGFRYRRMHQEICHAVFGYDKGVYLELINPVKENSRERFERLINQYDDKLVIIVDGLDLYYEESDKLEQVVFRILCERAESQENMIKDLREVGLQEITKFLNKEYLNKLFYKKQLIDSIEKLLVLSEYLDIQ